jgi:ZIP family zinc transporter
MSFALGFASGVLLATVAFSMLPEALRLASCPLPWAGFRLVSWRSMLSTFSSMVVDSPARKRKSPQFEEFYTRSKPRGCEVTVLAGGTSAEELIEGLNIGVGAVIKPGLALLIALAIIIDNLAESLSIGEIIRSERDGHKRREVWRILGWSGLIGAMLITGPGWVGFSLRVCPNLYSDSFSASAAAESYS